MAVWAYRCRPCRGPDSEWYVSQSAVEQMPRDCRIVRVHVDGEWLGAIVDRTHRVQVEGLIVRDVMASDAADCPECAKLLARTEPAATPARPAAPAQPVPGTQARSAPLTVQAAAIAVRSARVVVVAASMPLVTSAGEAHMAIEDLRPHFGGAAIVLMAQDEAGAPVYHGDPVIVQMLEGIPLERMPWKEYTFG